MINEMALMDQSNPDFSNEIRNRISNKYVKNHLTKVVYDSRYKSASPEESTTRWNSANLAESNSAGEAHQTFTRKQLEQSYMQIQSNKDWLRRRHTNNVKKKYLLSS